MTMDPTLERVQLDRDGVRGSWVTGVAIATVVVMGCGVLVAWEIARSGGRSPVAARFDEAPEDIQTIELSLLAGRPRENASRGTAPSRRPPVMFSEQQRTDNAARQQLSKYGWTDRSQGTVHIPLARALELYLEREGDRSGTPASGARAPAAPGSGGTPRAPAPGARAPGAPPAPANAGARPAEDPR